MLKQAEKWFPDLGTMVSGHLLIYVISAKGNHERIIPGVILFSTGLCIEWLLKTGLCSPPMTYLRKVWKSGQVIETDTDGRYTGGNAQYVIFVETTENQSGRYLLNCLNTNMNSYIKSKENNHHVIFLVDEIGQYIGDDRSLMLNLQNFHQQIL